MRGPLTRAQRELLEKVKGVALEQVLPRLIADGWLGFESLGKSTRLVAKR